MEPIGADPVVTLPEFLRARARASTPRRLVFDMVGGGAIAVAALWVKPPGWAVLASAALCFAMYGAWAVAERHVESDVREDRAVTEYAWFVLRTSAAGLGMAAFLALVFVLLGLALGTWIS
jgi:disulfide bond formation protein DsbB